MILHKKRFNKPFKISYMKNTLVSIIIPIYNGEPYLNQLLNCLINQSYKNIEIICVNNNSSDNSSHIIEKFIKLDNRIINLFCPNNGVSYAKNMGIQHSVGQYVMFVDCDDLLDYNAVAVAYYAMVENNVDMVSFGIQVMDIKKSAFIVDKHNYYNNGFFANKGIIQRDDVLLNAHLLPIFSFAKLYKADLIKTHNINFPTSVYYNEDVVFNFNYYSIMKHALYLNNYLYTYNVGNGNSIMGKIHLRYDDLFISTAIIKDMLINLGVFEIAKASFYLIAIRNISMLSRKKSLHKKDFYVKSNILLAEIDNELIKDKKIKLLKKSVNSFYIRYKLFSSIQYFICCHIPMKRFKR